jgi:hypothetical protein
MYCSHHPHVRLPSSLPSLWRGAASFVFFFFVFVFDFFVFFVARGFESRSSRRCEYSRLFGPLFVASSFWPRCESFKLHHSNHKYGRECVCACVCACVRGLRTNATAAAAALQHAAVAGTVAGIVAGTVAGTVAGSCLNPLVVLLYSLRTATYHTYMPHVHATKCRVLMPPE